MTKTNFDAYLEEQLGDPALAARFKHAGEAWDVAVQLAALREQAGLSQKQLARKLKTSQQQISRLESPGYEGHSLSMLRRVAKVLQARVRVGIEPAENSGALNEEPAAPCSIVASRAPGAELGRRMNFLKRLFGSGCSKSNPPSSPQPRKDAEAKADGEKLLDSLLPFAEKMLQEHREFFPFGGSMASDGTITHEGAHNGAEQPASQELIDLLRQAHQREACARKLRACATIYDMRTVPPGRTEKQDAIAAAIDHVSGYSAVVIFPYSFDAAQKLRVEAPFAVEGAHDIFPRTQKGMPEVT